MPDMLHWHCCDRLAPLVPMLEHDQTCPAVRESVANLKTLQAFNVMMGRLEDIRYMIDCGDIPDDRIMWEASSAYDIAVREWRKVRAEQ